MITDILVNIPADGSQGPATAFAVSSAAELKAHLTGLVFRYEPIMPVMVDMYGIPPDVLQSQRAENEKSARAAVARFEAAARDAAVSSETQIVDAAVDAAPGMLARMARRFDLSVIAQPAPHQSALGRLFVEAALFESGKPLLVVPYIQTAALKLGRVMVCWDGSRSAARALGDAMPFLIRAKTVEVTVISTEPAKSDEMPGADIAQHLARHGANVVLNRITSADMDIANTILSRAADASADFLVMGGYGHSRLREFILGGVTRGILASMTLPTLMSH
jgi:nucleotide-binding universal stress UspA family protein